MEDEHSRLDKGIIYTTGILLLDVMGGEVFTGRPLHESLGVELPSYLKMIENFALASGMTYSIVRSYNDSIRRKVKI